MREPEDVCEADGHHLEVEIDVDGEPAGVTCIRPGGCGRTWEIL